MKIIKIILLAACILFFINAKLVKNNYSLSKDYAVTIKGTSNLHAWTEKVGTVTGDGIVNWNADGTYDLASINIKMQVLSIKSDKGSIMNNNTYKALKADIHPEIIFTLTSPINTLMTKSNEKTISAKGNLSIAGVTKAIDIEVKAFITDKSKLVFEGSKKIKMTDFGVNPPTALLGTLKTGNDITIDFKTNFTITN